MLWFGNPKEYKQMRALAILKPPEKVAFPDRSNGNSTTRTTFAHRTAP